MEDKKTDINKHEDFMDAEITQLLSPKKEFHVSAGFKERVMKEVAQTESKRRHWGFIPWIASIAAIAAVVILIASNEGFHTNESLPLFAGISSKENVESDNNISEKSKADRTKELIAKSKIISEQVANQKIEKSVTLIAVGKPAGNAKRTKDGGNIKENSTKQILESEDPAAKSEVSGIKVEMGLSDVPEKGVVNASEDNNPSSIEQNVALATYQEHLAAGLAEYSGRMSLAPTEYSQSLQMVSGSMSLQNQTVNMEYAQSIPMTASNYFEPIPMEPIKKSNQIQLTFVNTETNKDKRINRYKGSTGGNNQSCYYDEEYPGTNDEKNRYTKDEMAKIRRIEQLEYVARMRLEVELAESFVKQIQSCNP